MIRRLSTVLALALCVSSPARVNAQVAVFDGANYYLNQGQYALAQKQWYQDVQNALKFAAQEKHEFDILQQTLRAGCQLPGACSTTQYWSSLATHLDNVDNLFKTYNILDTRASNLAAVFQKLYPAYVPPANFGSIYKTQRDNTRASAQAVLQTVGMSLNDLNTTQARLQQHAAKIDSSQSALDVAKAGAAVNTQVVEQLTKLQSLDAVRTQFEVQYYMQQDAARTKTDNSNAALGWWMTMGAQMANSTSLPRF